MLNLRVAFGASRTSHVYFIRSYRIIHSKSAQYSRHFVPLEPRILLLFIHFVHSNQKNVREKSKKVSG